MSASEAMTEGREKRYPATGHLLPMGKRPHKHLGPSIRTLYKSIVNNVERQSSASIEPVNRPKLPAGNNRGLQQAYDIRDFTANLLKSIQASIQDENGMKIIRDEYGKPVDAAAVASLVKAWSEACDRIRILRGRPLPGSLKPEKPKPKLKVLQGPTES